MENSNDGFLVALAAVVIFALGAMVGAIISEYTNGDYKEGYCAALGATNQDNLCLFENGTYKEIPND